MMPLIKSLPIFLVIAAIGLIVSCEDDKTTNPQDQAPTIPPQSSLLVNIQEFPDTSKVGGYDNPSLTKGNWAWAAGNIKYWNSVLTVTLTVPAAAFAEAFNHQPVQQSDGSWLWKYSVTVNEETYTAKLFGMNLSYGVDWKMLLSKSGSYTDLEWFTGFSNLSATEGNWIVNNNPDLPSPFLSIEWKRNIQEETADIKYTLVSPTIQHNGSYIFYGKTNEVPLNRFYQIFNSENSNLIDIKWNYESKFGRVKDTVYFEDINWHCWDERLDDTNCTE
jgi:hypothetical protein